MMSCQITLTHNLFGLNREAALRDKIEATFLAHNLSQKSEMSELYDASIDLCTSLESANFASSVYCEQNNANVYIYFNLCSTPLRIKLTKTDNNCCAFIDNNKLSNNS